MMASTFPTTKIIQALGIGGAAWLSGSIASISLITVPALQVSKTEDGMTSIALARQWRNIFISGKSQAPPFALLSASSFAFLAWNSRGLGSRNRLLMYTVGALLTVSIVPFTLIAMNPTNNKLLAHAAVADKKESKPSQSALNDSEVDKLLDKWSNLNLARSLLPLTAFAIGILNL